MNSAEDAYIGNKCEIMVRPCFGVPHGLGVAGGREQALVVVDALRLFPRVDAVWSVAQIFFIHWKRTKGASINDVSKNFGFFYPFPPLVRKLTQPPLLMLLTMYAFEGNPLPPLSADVINGSPLTNLTEAKLSSDDFRCIYEVRGLPCMTSELEGGPQKADKRKQIS